MAFALDLAEKNSCEYAEARFQKTSETVCFTRNGVPEPAVIAEAEGIGIRVIYGGALAFGATNLLTRESVRELVYQVVRNAGSASAVTREKIHFSKEESHVQKWSVDERKKLENISVDTLIAFLKEIDNALASPLADVSFPNRNLYLGHSTEEKLYENSEGSRLESRVPRVQYLGLIVSLYNGKPGTISVPPGYSGLGGTGGWEIVESLNLVDRLPSQLKEMTMGIKASAKPPRDETLDVILGPNVAGLTSHESCGHPGEADRILGREGAQAGESFLKPDKLGMQIGSSE
ncbi:MAG: PmbA/TldA family metallopeptidase, partial [Rhabdochlamydiaceae bacterium]